MQDVRLERCGEQVVRGADRMDVAGEVEVQVLHRDDLGVATAGGAALDPEDGAERGLAQAEDRFPADLAEALRERDRRGRLPSPAFVGVIAVTQTIGASCLPARRSRTERSTFALYFP